MFASKRLTSVAAITVLAGTLAACGTTTTTTSTPVGSYPGNSYPTSSYPSNTYPTTSSPTAGYVEFGRVTNIEMVTNTTSTNRGNVGTVVGGVAGALLGNTIGGGSGRAVATVLGAVGGAVVGNKVANANQPDNVSSAYRVQVNLDNGTSRTYEVGGTGDLRVGDRVRIENNVLYRS